MIQMDKGRLIAVGEAKTVISESCAITERILVDQPKPVQISVICTIFDRLGITEEDMKEISAARKENKKREEKNE